jgi:ABC-type nitrate/sulfonate/bicarbonate transport system permease component
VERTLTLRKPQSPLQAALYQSQQRYIFQNPAKDVSVLSEMLAVVAHALSDQMLFRAVLLTGGKVLLAEVLGALLCSSVGVLAHASHRLQNPCVH